MVIYHPSKEAFRLKMALGIRTFPQENEMLLQSCLEPPFQGEEMLRLWIPQTRRPTTSLLLSQTCPFLFLLSPLHHGYCSLSFLCLCRLSLPFPLSLSHGSQTVSGRPATAMCMRGWVPTKVQGGAVGCLSAQEIEFHLPWPRLISEPEQLSLQWAVGLRSRHYQGEGGGRWKIVYHQGTK